MLGTPGGGGGGGGGWQTALKETRVHAGYKMTSADFFFVLFVLFFK